MDYLLLYVNVTSWCNWLMFSSTNVRIEHNTFCLSPNSTCRRGFQFVSAFGATIRSQSCSLTVSPWPSPTQGGSMKGPTAVCPTTKMWLSRSDPPSRWPSKCIVSVQVDMSRSCNSFWYIQNTLDLSYCLCPARDSSRNLTIRWTFDLQLRYWVSLPIKEMCDYWPIRKHKKHLIVHWETIQTRRQNRETRKSSHFFVHISNQQEVKTCFQTVWT